MPRVQRWRLPLTSQMQARGALLADQYMAEGADQQHRRARNVKFGAGAGAARAPFDVEAQRRAGARAG